MLVFIAYRSCLKDSGCITDLIKCKQHAPGVLNHLPNGLRLHQFLGTKTTEANKSLKTDANGAH